MTVESAGDRAAFLADFGVAVTWTRGAAPSTFAAIFERPTQIVDDGSVSVIDRVASLVCSEADLPTGAAIDDAVSVAGESVTFKCQAIKPDGSGMAIVGLKKA